MMKVIDEKLQEQKGATKQLLQRLQQFTLRIGHNESGRILADLRDRVDEPYMFVIVGEVKAGKSSFINALAFLVFAFRQWMTESIRDLGLCRLIWATEEIS